MIHILTRMCECAAGMDLYCSYHILCKKGPLSCMVNVLKFRTLYPIPFLAKILLFIQFFLKILSGMAV